MNKNLLEVLKFYGFCLFLLFAGHISQGIFVTMLCFSIGFFIQIVKRRLSALAER